MAHHDPKTCNKVPYTAYYSNGNWSSRFRCPDCGKVSRQVVSVLEGYETACDGQTIVVTKDAPRAPDHLPAAGKLKDLQVVDAE